MTEMWTLRAPGHDWRCGGGVETAGAATCHQQAGDTGTGEHAAVCSGAAGWWADAACRQCGTSQSPDKDTAAVLQCCRARPIRCDLTTAGCRGDTPQAACCRPGADSCQGLSFCPCLQLLNGIASVAADAGCSSELGYEYIFAMFIPSQDGQLPMSLCPRSVAGKFCTKSWFTTTANHTAARQSRAGTQTRTKTKSKHKSKLPDRTNFGGSGKHFLFLQSSTSILLLHQVTVVLEMCVSASGNQHFISIFLWWTFMSLPGPASLRTAPRAAIH